MENQYNIIFKGTAPELRKQTNMICIVLPVKSLKAVGTLLRCVTQKTSCFFVIYNPGSTIIGFARWYLQISMTK